MSGEDIKELVKAANEATKGLDAEVRSKAFEIVLNHLLAGGVASPRRAKPKTGGPAERKPRKAAAPSSIAPIPVDLKPKGGKSLRDFYEEKAPTSHAEKVTVFTYYLNKTAKVDDVLPGHALSCYNEVGERKPGALKQLFADVIADKGWLERGGASGSVRVTITGENLVEHDLPRKAAE